MILKDRELVTFFGVSPVTGIKPITTAILINTWTSKTDVNPKDKYVANISLQESESLYPI